MNEKTINLDKKDRQILSLLNQDARQSIADISRELGVQRDTVYNRIDRMERKGLISRYRPIIQPEVLGYDLFAIVMLQITPTPSEQLSSFTEQLVALPHVTHANKTAGSYDYVLYTAHQTMEQFNSTLDQIKSIQPGLVQKIEVVNILDELKTDDFSGLL